MTIRMVAGRFQSTVSWFGGAGIWWPGRTIGIPDTDRGVYRVPLSTAEASIEIRPGSGRSRESTPVRKVDPTNQSSPSDKVTKSYDSLIVIGFTDKEATELLSSLGHKFKPTPKAADKIPNLELNKSDNLIQNLNNMAK